MRPLRPDEPPAIGPYRLVGVIGSGGMGRVFLGIAPDGRLAAVKQVLAGIADDPGFRSRFAREVDASRRVSGAHTAPVLDADPAAGTPWLASLYVPGPSLQQAVDSYGPLPDPALRRLAVGLASALAEIHRAGLIHRDLKPGNVLLTDDGPRVIDFGIAHVLHDAAPLTRTGAVVGSPGFMAPEQLDDRTVTPATDVFALGAVLALAAGGVAPFGRGTPQAMLYRVLIGDPRPVRRRAAAAPAPRSLHGEGARAAAHRRAPAHSVRTARTHPRVAPARPAPRRGGTDRRGTAPGRARRRAATRHRGPRGPCAGARRGATARPGRRRRRGGAGRRRGHDDRRPADPRRRRGHRVGRTASR
jgi:serine/threonine protein kinase